MIKESMTSNCSDKSNYSYLSKVYLYGGIKYQSRNYQMFVSMPHATYLQGFSWFSIHRFPCRCYGSLESASHEEYAHQKADAPKIVYYDSFTFLTKRQQSNKQQKPHEMVPKRNNNNKRLPMFVRMIRN